MKYTMFLILSLTMATLLFGGELKLANREQGAQYTIVLPEDRHPAYDNAAKELVSFIAEITGVTLNITDDSQPLPAKAILIGPNRHSAALLGSEYSPDAMGMDDFRLKVQSGHLIILGKERGAQYGVYELLERFGHCRWYASWHSVIPKAECFAIPDDLDDFQKPAFAWRDPYWYDMLFFTYQALRNRCNGSASISDNLGGKLYYCNYEHSMGQMVTSKEFWEDHPEYFCMRNGQRQKDGFQLCLSNPDVLKIVTVRTLDTVRKSAKAKIVCVSQNDNGNYCQCPACEELAARYGGQSGIMLWFVNQVAEVLERECPDTYVQTLAYQYTRTPPENITARPNIIIRLCTNECDFAHSLEKSTDPATISFACDLRKWGQIARQVFIWDYVTNFNHYMAPHPNLGVLQPNLQLFRDNHVVGVLEQGNYQSYHGDFAELKGWLLAKLLWNPNQDVNTLINDFLDGFYGKAAPFIRQYIDLMQVRTEESATSITTFERLTNPFFDDVFLDAADDLWRKALEAVKNDPKVLYNVRKGAMSISYTRLAKAGKFHQEYKWHPDRIELAQGSSRLLEQARQFFLFFDQEHDCMISESESPNGKFCKYWRAIAALPNETNLTVRTIKNSSCTVAISPELGAAIGYLSAADGYDCLKGKLGGILAYCPTDSQPANMTVINGNDNTQVQCQGSFGKTGKLQFRAELQDDSSLSLFYDVTGQSLTDSVMALACPFALDTDGNLAYRLGKNPWQKSSITQGWTEGRINISSASLKGDATLTIASPKSARGVRIHFSDHNFQIISLRLHPAENAAVLFITRELGQSGNPLQVIITPIAGISDLPESVAFQQPSIPVVEAEEGAFKLDDGRGAVVADPAAENGVAVKLFNNHYQWCFCADTSSLNLVSGTRYRLQFRLRVAKTAATHGEVFWGGIYDGTSNSTLGELDLDIKDAKEGYCWYDAGEWVADHTHHIDIWSGPGKFSDSASNPAHDGVFVDRIRCIPCQQQLGSP